MRMIDADELDRVMTTRAALDRDKNRKAWARAICCVHDAPTVDAESVRHGHWIDGAQNFTCGNFDYECSRCGANINSNLGCDEDFNYCPFCGAKMEGTENE